MNTTPEYALHNTAILSVAGESPRRGLVNTTLHTLVYSPQHSHSVSRWGVTKTWQGEHHTRICSTQHSYPLSRWGVTKTWQGEHHTTHPNILYTTQPSSQSPRRGRVNTTLHTRICSAQHSYPLSRWGVTKTWQGEHHTTHPNILYTTQPSGQSPRRGRVNTTLHTRICSAQHSHPVSRWGVAKTWQGEHHTRICSTQHSHSLSRWGVAKTWQGEHHTTHPSILCTTQLSTQSLGSHQDVAG